MKTQDAWPNWVGGVVALAALAVDMSMLHLLRSGLRFEALVLAASWLSAAILVLACIAPGAWRRAPRLFAGIAVAHPVTQALGFDPDRTSYLVLAAVMALAFVVVVVPMDLCIARLDARRIE